MYIYIYQKNSRPRAKWPTTSGDKNKFKIQIIENDYTGRPHILELQV